LKNNWSLYPVLEKQLVILPSAFKTAQLIQRSKKELDSLSSSRKKEPVTLSISRKNQTGHYTQFFENNCRAPTVSEKPPPSVQSSSKTNCTLNPVFEK